MKFVKTIPVTIVLMLCYVFASGQVTISGKITDELTREPLISANVVIKGTTTGSATDLEGVFKFEVPDTVNQVTLVISYIGYEDREVVMKKPFQFTDLRMKNFVVAGEEVVISGSRVKESVMESGISIDKIDAREIKTAPSGNFYSGLSTLADIDVISSSAAFNVVNMRGFNTTQPERSVQYIDGIDNQAPGLNFAVGNLMGANDLDLQSVEIIHGPSSAMYGANAFQGVVSMTTKDPFNFPGLGIQIKGGTRNYFDVQGRYARTFGKKDNWGFKIAAAYMRIDDWPADDDSANVYGDIDPEVNMSEIVRQLQFKQVGTIEDGDTFTQSDLDDAIALNSWLDFNGVANPGTQTIVAPGIPESAVADYNSTAWRINPTLYWKYKKNHEVSAMAKYGRGTSVYQGTNRYSIKDITYQQYKLEFKGKNYMAQAYTTIEDAGDSYDNVFTAINISKEGVGEYVGEYISTYFDALDSIVGGFSNCPDCVRPYHIEEAKRIAEDSASTKWIYPGTPKFDSLFQAITTDPDLQTGSKFLDESKFVNVDGYYNFRDLWEWMEVLVGASYRTYLPKSYGTIFSDSLVNPGDTLPDGKNDPDAEYHKIVTHEFGIFAQAVKRLFNNKLKLEFSIRMDKYTNFDPQVSPRGSIVFNHNNHTLRISGAAGYRLPTLQDQYIHLNLGPITLIGNLNGFPDSYTWSSVEAFLDTMDAGTSVPSDSMLEVYKIEPLRPERVRTLEVGYRTIQNKVFYIDFTFYHNWYSDFIGDIRIAEIEAGKAGEESGFDQIIARKFELKQIPVNSKSTVRTWGFSVGLSYYFGRGITLKGNYTYSDINEEDIDDDLIPGFNTPKHKFNLGLEGKRIWKGLGFNSNFRWSDTYYWESPFGDGQIPPYFTLDAQLNYEFKEYYTTIAVGGSNLIDREYRTAYGSPLIGRMFYASLIFDINKW